MLSDYQLKGSLNETLSFRYIKIGGFHKVKKHVDSHGEETIEKLRKCTLGQ